VKILITRPQERIEPLKTKLEEMGHECIVYPLFSIIPLEFESFDVDDYDGVIITSFYALPVLFSHSPHLRHPEGSAPGGESPSCSQAAVCEYEKGSPTPTASIPLEMTKGVDNTPLFVVGESLSKTLPNSHVFSCVKELKASLDPTLHYLYLRGEDVSEELHDISHDARIVYKTQQTQHLLCDFEGVVIFSKRTGEIFERLIDQTDHLEIFTLSPQIAQNLKKRYKKIHIAQNPTLEYLLKILTKC
jgi:uroporphyrinogen-III synthase